MSREDREIKKRQKENPNSKKFQNKEFARITYFFVLLFLAMMGYLLYFTAVRAKDIVNSPYNARQDNFADLVIRGDLSDRNGNTLAHTEVAEDGTEMRQYPYGDLFAHVIGYNHPELGKTGLESVENFSLLSSNAFFLEKMKDEFQDQKHRGDTVVTTLDAGLQQTAYQALGDNKGAVVVMEASTGKILVMLSKPSYDPNQIEMNWSYLNADEDNSPMLNRATQGSYAPGSTFKVVTALEYMREHPDYENYTYECAGEITSNDVTIRCFDSTVHGFENLRSSFANSCNASFVNIGLSLNRSSYAKTAEDLLFNKKLPCMLDYTKSSFSVDQSTGEAEVMMTAMGQGKTLVSPYHMALITSAVANGGILMEPYLVEKVTNHTGREIKKNVPKSYRKLISSDEAAQLKDYMRAVVDEGTGMLLSGQSYTAAGKTGTAEYAMDDGEKMHSWFMGFTNVDNPELVISVIVEGYDGNDGAKAVPIAKQILDAYYY